MVKVKLKETYCYVCSENFPKRPSHNNPPDRRKKMTLVKRGKYGRQFFCPGCGMTTIYHE